MATYPPNKKAKTFFSTVTSVGVNPVEQSIPKRLEELQICPFDAGGCGINASSASFTTSIQLGGIRFLPYRGEDNVSGRKEGERRLLKQYMDFAKDAQKDQYFESAYRFDNSEVALVDHAVRAWGGDLDTLYTDHSKRTYEGRWQPVVDTMVADLFGRDSVFIKSGCQNLCLPRELCLFFSIPKPDWIVYQTADSRLMRGTGNLSLPLFHLEGNGRDGGIDSAVPEDAHTSFAIAQVYTVLGVPPEEVVVLHAAVGTGVVTQFFVSFFGDLESCKIPDVPSSGTASPVASSPSYSPAPVRRAFDFNLSLPPSGASAPHPRYDLRRCLYVLPLTKKLDPCDIAERRMIGRMLVLLRRHAFGLRNFFSVPQFILRAAAEPGEDEEDRDEDGGLVRADNDVTVAEEAEGIEEVDNKLELYHSEYAPAMSRVH